jgi:hypothetical protein
MKRMVALILLMVLFALNASAQAPAGGSCDRECLRGFITQYLNAMVEHNPKALATAPSVRFTEDTVTMSLGEGLWKNASKLRTYRQDILDVREGVAASRHRRGSWKTRDAGVAIEDRRPEDHGSRNDGDAKPDRRRNLQY